MRALIYGGRVFHDWPFAYTALWRLAVQYGFTVVIHGQAKGADTLADQWATVVGLPVFRYPADWERLGRAAGGTRNQQMIDEGKPDIGVGFPGGVGTADMTRRLRRHNIPVIEVAP